jgi:hypothetical protein
VSRSAASQQHDSTGILIEPVDDPKWAKTGFQYTSYMREFRIITILDRQHPGWLINDQQMIIAPYNSNLI